MEARIKKGILEMCLLFTISKNEMYGYDVMKIMKKHFPEVNESTFYAILRRLHSVGSAEILLGSTSNDPTRKYYKITSSGLDALQNNITSWKRIRGIVQHIGIE